MAAASLFGTIIAQANEIVASFTTQKKNLDEILDVYLNLNPRCLSFPNTSNLKFMHTLLHW